MRITESPSMDRLIAGGLLTCGHANPLTAILKNMKRAYVLHPDDRAEPVELPDTNQLAVLQRHVGGYIEAVYGGQDEHGRPTVTFWCNEEGKLQGLPINRRATAYWWLLDESAAGVDALCGSVVVTGFADDNGHTLPIPEAMIRIIEMPYETD